MPAFSLKITPPAGKTLSAVSVTTLVRSDNGFAPTGVSLPIALTLTSGQWVGSFSEASPPASYFYTLLLTYSDGSTAPSNTGTLPSGTLVGVYGDINDIMLAMGKLNAEISADPDNLQDVNEITLHKQQAIRYADSTINTRLQLGKCVTPATVNLDQLQLIFGDIGASKLYRIRGFQETNPKSNAFKDIYDRAVEDLEELIFMNRGGFTRVAGYSDAPAGVSATVNSNGQPIRQTLRWNPYGYWTW